MTDVSDHYRNAQHYDHEYADLTVDIKFNVELAKELAPEGEKLGRVLEFCAGTGRITFPLVEAGLKAGFKVVGVDITPAMLEIATQKLATKPKEVRERLELVEGDMCTVDVGKNEFDLVLIPFNSFMHMTTPEAQLAALINAWQHLKPGGHFMADIFLPDVTRLARNLGPSWLEMKKMTHIEDEGVVLIRSGSFEYLQHNQLLKVTWLYKVCEHEGDRRLLREYWSPLEIRVIFAGEWPLLLEKAGFKIVNKWGAFDKSPFGEGSGRMLFLCQKPK